MTTLQTFLVLSLLLEYPSEEVVSDLDLLAEKLCAEATDNRGAAQMLSPLIKYLRMTPPIELEETYTETFEHKRKHSLYLYEHLYGEDAMRGIALADLRAKYAGAGYTPDSSEPPDFAPYVLEYLSLIPKEEALQTLGKIVSFRILEQNLEESGSLYTLVFRALVHMMRSEPRALPKAPVHDMDEALEMFGVDQYGGEPLIEGRCSVRASAQ